MKTKMTSFFARFSRDEEGATLVEYGVALGLAVMVGATAFSTLSDDVGTRLGEASSALDTPATTG
jgi:Flp pilus assembly pilin Flp